MTHDVLPKEIAGNPDYYRRCHDLSHAMDKAFDDPGSSLIVRLSQSLEALLWESCGATATVYKAGFKGERVSSLELFASSFSPSHLDVASRQVRQEIVARVRDGPGEEYLSIEDGRLRNGLLIPLAPNDQLWGYLLIAGRPQPFTEVDKHVYLEMANILDTKFGLVDEMWFYAEMARSYAPDRVETAYRNRKHLSPKHLITSIVMFADLVGSTGAAEGRPADAFPVMNHYVSRLVRTVFANDGRFDKTIGDSVMAVWPDQPVDAQPDDYRNALKAALEMREFVAKARRDKPSGLAYALSDIKIGLNAGPLMTGWLTLDDEGRIPLAYTVLADTVNRAARIESACRPGEILISQPVYEMVEDDVRVDRRRTIKAKGVKQGLVVYPVLGLK